MITKIECSGCRKDLEIVDISVNPLQLTTVEVEPCKNMDCYDCSQCEELNWFKIENKKLKEQIAEIKSVIEGSREQNETNNQPSL